jgi:alpha-tubulin suppressor-like RCC1 family protein
MKRKIVINTLCTIFLCSILAASVSAQTFSWGYNGSGQLGFRSEQRSFPLPQTISALSDVTGISGGEDVSLFLRANGTIAAAGSNGMGAMGIGQVPFPYPIPSTVLNLNDVAQVSGGKAFSTALKSDGTVWAWGGNWYGQLGNGTLNTPGGAGWTYLPGQTLISDVVQISTSPALHSVALKSDGTVWGWGYSPSWQAGAGPFFDVPSRVGTTVAGFENLVAVTTGSLASAAVKSDGTVWIWGFGGYALEGDGTESTNLPPSQGIIPRQVPNFGDVVQVVAGDLHFAALKRDGTVWAWGINTEGECGVGSLSDFRYGKSSTRGSNRATPFCLVPTQVLSDVVEIKSGGWHLLARKRDGSVWVWGVNHEGQIGSGVLAQNSLFYATPIPTQAPVGTGNALIGAATRSSYAVKPVIQTPAGFGVRHYGENVQMFFTNVTIAGTTSYTALDVATTGLKVPAGYAIQTNQPAYNVSTTAQTAGETEVCIKVNEYDGAEFALLKILHAEGGVWIDRTFSGDFIRRRICARVTSPSSFVIAKPASAISDYERRIGK